jgi:hypothetical protein
MDLHSALLRAATDVERSSPPCKIVLGQKVLKLVSHGFKQLKVCLLTLSTDAR